MTGSSQQGSPVTPSLDLNSTPPNHNYKASIQPDENPADRFVRLFKEVVVFLFAVGLAAIIIWLCCRAILSPAVSAEEQKWAMSVLSGISGGVIGYLLKR